MPSQGIDSALRHAAFEKPSLGLLVFVCFRYTLNKPERILETHFDPFEGKNKDSEFSLGFFR
jgi:hypothetical protein